MYPICLAKHLCPCLCAACQADTKIKFLMSTTSFNHEASSFMIYKEVFFCFFLLFRSSVGDVLGKCFSLAGFHFLICLIPAILSLFPEQKSTQSSASPKSPHLSSWSAFPKKSISTNVVLHICDISNVIHVWVHKNFEFYFFAFSDAHLHEQVLMGSTQTHSFIWESVIASHTMLSLRASYVPYHSFTFPCILCTLPLNLHLRPPTSGESVSCHLNITSSHLSFHEIWIWDSFWTFKVSAKILSMSFLSSLMLHHVLNFSHSSFSLQPCDSGCTAHSCQLWDRRNYRPLCHPGTW